jgi:hypothetical protein
MFGGLKVCKVVEDGFSHVLEESKAVLDVFKGV